MSDERKTFGHLIEIDIAEDELKEMRTREHDLIRELLEIEAEKTAANSEFTSRRTPLRKEQAALNVAIDIKRTKREVQCYHEKDERRGIMLTMRADNGFIVDERALTVEELNEGKQGSLFVDKSAGAPDVEGGSPEDETQEESDPIADDAVSAYSALLAAASGGDEGASGEGAGEDGEEEDDGEHDSDETTPAVVN